jgi:tetratricopeptide (TPR) repeat protein
LVPERKKDDIAHSHWLAHQPRPIQQIVQWIEKYRKSLIFGSIFVLIVAVVWGSTVYYHERKQIKAADIYAALPLDSEDTKYQRQAAMAELAKEYSNTGAGIIARFKLGQEAFKEKNYSEAARWFEGLKGLSNKQAMISILARHNLAAIYEAQGDWQRALEIYQKVAADPANRSVAISYYHLGRAYEALGRLDEARKWFEKSIEKGMGLAIADRAKERLLWLDISKSS